MNRNAKKLFLGRVISTLGDSIYRLAVVIYIYKLTNNAFYTGIASALTMAPKALGFLFGPIIDRSNKKNILVISQFLQFLLILIVPIAIYFHIESVWLILSIIFLLSFIENFEGTAEISIVPQLVEKESFGKYNSLVGSTQQLIDITSAGFFAIIIARFSIANIYIFNAFTFLIASIFFIRIKGIFNNTGTTKFESYQEYKNDLKYGFKSFFGTMVFKVCVPFLIANFVFGIVIAILPAYVSINMGASFYGYFLLAISIGILIGSMLAVKLMKYPLGLVMSVLPFISFILWIISLLITSNIVSIVVFGIAFIPFGVIRVILITYLQMSIPKDLIARVSSIIDSMLVSTLPIGSLLGGLFAQIFGSNIMMFLGSFGLVAISLFFLLQGNLRKLPSVGEMTNVS